MQWNTPCVFFVVLIKCIRTDPVILSRGSTSEACFSASLFLRDLYSETQVAELLFQVLSAVDYLHSRRVIHLDLKSDNMLVDDGNHLKIIDFGSAQSFTPGQPLQIEHIQGLSDNKGKDECLTKKIRLRDLNACVFVGSSNVLNLWLSWPSTDCRRKGTHSLTEDGLMDGNSST